MLFTVSTTHRPATDLGFLLYKHPERSQAFDVASGKAHVFYPEATDKKCTVALVLEIDPVKLVRGNENTRNEAWTLEQYVNDRPYVASSFLSVALREVFGTAMGGNCKERPELAEMPIPLEAYLSAVPCPGDGSLIKELFEPLGYEVEIEPIQVDPDYPAWGTSPYFAVTFVGEQLLTDLLSHVYVLAPVLDGDKHYWVGDDEVEKLLRHGKGWLAEHPMQELIAQRYLKYQRNLTEQALDELDASEDSEGDLPEAGTREPAGHIAEERTSLNVERMEAVERLLVDSDARTVLDLGCGEGKLMKRLRRHDQFQEIVGVDVSYRALERAAGRLRLSGWPDIQDERVILKQGSLLYRDRSLQNFDAAALIEVIEHLDPPKLATLEEIVFGDARPRLVAVTTPNREYNAEYDALSANDMRHSDHRFEWTREEFAAWANRVAGQYGYEVSYRGIGERREDVGTPTQMAVFEFVEEREND